MYQKIYFLYSVMTSQLYFDISSEESGGSLDRMTNQNGATSFMFHHSVYDAYSGDIKVYRTAFDSFELFWKDLTKNKQWFYLHPLYVHPDVREFVQQQLTSVDWTIQGDLKWQESHRRQWKKVLSDPGSYYKPSL